MASLVEFKKSLTSLKMSKSQILLLTKTADALVADAHAVVDVIIEYMNTVEVAKKMPVLYLLDSILKTVGSPFTEILERRVTRIFCTIFLKGDKSIRKMLFDVRRGWNERFSPRLLIVLDHKVRQMDPAWPAFQKWDKPGEELRTLTPTSSSSPGTSTASVSPEDNSTDQPHFELVYVGRKEIPWPQSPNVQSWIRKLPPPPQCEASRRTSTEDVPQEAQATSSRDLSVPRTRVVPASRNREEKKSKKRREVAQSPPAKRQKKTAIRSGSSSILKMLPSSIPPLSPI